MPDLSREEMERRRFEAAALLECGVRQSSVGRLYEVSRTTTSRWARLAKAGHEAIKRRKPGRPFSVDRQKIEDLFRERPHWSNSQLVTAIEARLGVRYGPDHVGRILRGLRGPKGASHA